MAAYRRISARILGRGGLRHSYEIPANEHIRSPPGSKTVLIAMQKVEGSNPISRFASNPCKRASQPSRRLAPIPPRFGQAAELSSPAPRHKWPRGCGTPRAWHRSQRLRCGRNGIAVAPPGQHRRWLRLSSRWKARPVLREEPAPGGQNQGQQPGPVAAGAAIVWLQPMAKAHPPTDRFTGLVTPINRHSRRTA
jgi:hypothetical protein